MNREEFVQAIRNLGYGKRLPTATYLWAEGSSLWPGKLAELVRKLRDRLALGSEFNVLKLSDRDYAISFLRYPTFLTDPHPVLAESVRVDLATGKTRRISFESHSNPPILHRKETFLPPGHPKIPQFGKLTKQEEAAGLYEHPATIGFLHNWRRLLQEKGLEYKGHQLVASAKTDQTEAVAEPTVQVHRHRTAMARTELSKPVRQAMELELLRPGVSVFDYGCGLGTDAEGLGRLRYTVNAWDPTFFPEGEKTHADLVNLGYVLNVIEDPAERVEVLVDAWKYTRNILIVSTMIRGQESYDQVRDFGDGVLTSRDTFQKYFDPAEIQSLIETALEADAHPLSMGIYAVFRDPRDAQRFLASRARRHIDWDQLSRRLGFLRPPRKVGVVDLYQRHKELLDDFWTVVLSLGRLPRKGEYEREAELREKVGGPKKVHRLFLEHYGPETYDAARRQRKEDLLVYLAMANFRKRVPLKDLDESLQSDLKSHFGTYRNAQEEGLQMLFATGNEESLEAAVSKLPFGWLDEMEGHFSFHRSLLDELPAILRIYVECGAQLYGNPREADVIKIHLWSKKLTFLHYHDFDRDPFPELRLRIKIDLPRMFVTVFDHTLVEEHQILFFKERFLGTNDPMRPKAETISRRLEKLGMALSSLGSNDQHAPSRELFDQMLERAGLSHNLTRKPTPKSDH
jgi:DNA phosphorothioation-associated putative methyltransferase